MGGALHGEAQLLHGPLQVLLGRQCAPGGAQIHIAAEVNRKRKSFKPGLRLTFFATFVSPFKNGFNEFQ